MDVLVPATQWEVNRRTIESIFEESSECPQTQHRRSDLDHFKTMNFFEIKL